MQRCAWVSDDPLYVDYHDREWGVPVRDDRLLFEMLTLEGAQAGLSWITVLRKRARYRQVFAGFDITAVAAFSDRQLDALLQDPGIIRNRLKVYATRSNAQALLALRADHGSFADYLWDYVGGEPVINHWHHHEVPARTPLSDHLSRDLRRAGFRFVGSTICYAFLQATGLVMDHTVDCFRHRQLA
jgi:DNA-3-methyladenine glycosylase I